MSSTAENGTAVTYQTEATTDQERGLVTRRWGYNHTRSLDDEVVVTETAWGNLQESSASATYMWSALSLILPLHTQKAKTKPFAALVGRDTASVLCSPVQDQVPVLQMGGLEESFWKFFLLSLDSIQCPLGYEPRLHQMNRQGTHSLHLHTQTSKVSSCPTQGHVYQDTCALSKSYKAILETWARRSQE